MTTQAENRSEADHPVMGANKFKRNAFHVDRIFQTLFNSFWNSLTGIEE